MASVEELQLFVDKDPSLHEPTDAELLAIELANSFHEQSEKGVVEKLAPQDLLNTETTVHNYWAGLRILQTTYGLTLETRFLNPEHTEWDTVIRALPPDDPLRTIAKERQEQDPDLPEVTVEDLDGYYGEGTRLGNRLAYSTGRWHLALLNRICQAGLEQNEEFSDQHSLSLVNDVALYKHKSEAAARAAFIEVAVRLAQMPLDTPDSLELHSLMTGCNWAADSVLYYMDDEGYGKDDIDVLLGLDNRGNL